MTSPGFFPSKAARSRSSNSHMGVSTIPGLTAFTRMPNGPNSSAIARVSPCRAVLLVLYTFVAKDAMREDAEATMTILPPPRAAIRAATGCTKWNVPSKFTDITSRQTLGVNSRNGCIRITPALATAPESPSRWSSTSATQASTAAWSVTSNSWAVALPPAAQTSSATVCAAPPSRSEIATIQPWDAKCSAVARPIPRPAPVIATLRVVG